MFLALCPFHAWLDWCRCPARRHDDGSSCACLRSSGARRGSSWRWPRPVRLVRLKIEWPPFISFIVVETCSSFAFIPHMACNPAQSSPAVPVIWTGAVPARCTDGAGGSGPGHGRRWATLQWVAPRGRRRRREFQLWNRQRVGGNSLGRGRQSWYYKRTSIQVSVGQSVPCLCCLQLWVRGEAPPTK